MPTSAPIAHDALDAFLNAHFGEKHPEMVIAARPPHTATVIAVQSVEPNSVVLPLLRSLKEAARGQFTTTRAGVLIVQFLDLDADDLLSLAAHDSSDPATASSLQIATNIFLDSAEHAHVHTLVYRSHGTVQRTTYIAGDRAHHTLQEQSPTYHFTNRRHPFAGDPRYSVFAADVSTR